MKQKIRRFYFLALESANWKVKIVNFFRLPNEKYFIREIIRLKAKEFCTAVVVLRRRK